MFRRLFKINLCDCGMRCHRHIYTFIACERTCSIWCATVFGSGGHKVVALAALHGGRARDEIAKIKSINADIGLHRQFLCLYKYARAYIAFCLHSAARACVHVCVFEISLNLSLASTLCICSILATYELMIRTQKALLRIFPPTASLRSPTVGILAAHMHMDHDRPTDYLRVGTLHDGSLRESHKSF